MVSGGDSAAVAATRVFGGGDGGREGGFSSGFTKSSSLPSTSLPRSFVGADQIGSEAAEGRLLWCVVGEGSAMGGLAHDPLRTPECWWRHVDHSVMKVSSMRIMVFSQRIASSPAPTFDTSTHVRYSLIPVQEKWQEALVEIEELAPDQIQPFWK